MPPTQPKNLNKKHLARVERERITRRNLLFVAIAFVVVIIGVIGYGVYATQILPPQQPIAKIGNDIITTKDFQDRVRFERNNLVNQYINLYQYVLSMSDNPDMANYFKQNLEQVKAQLEPDTIGEQTLGKMIQDVLVRQEAARRGLTASEEEISKRIQEDFGYSEGGPTPTSTLFPTLGPTSTKNAQQMTLVPDYTNTPTATPAMTATATLTATPTLIPSPTSVPSITPSLTPYTLELFNTRYKETLDRLQEEIQFGETQLRELYRTEILRKKILAQITADLPLSQEQVWARHILVADEDTAKKVAEELKTDPDWKTLAAKYSTDEGSKNNGGDLGWFGKGMMVPEFEQAVFSLAIGETSAPVKTQFGWHIIQALGHENRPVSAYEFQQISDKAFSDLIEKLKNDTKIDTYDDVIKANLPTVPDIPEGIGDIPEIPNPTGVVPLVEDTPSPTAKP